jgi:hypothetical protein
MELSKKKKRRRRRRERCEMGRNAASLVGQIERTLRILSALIPHYLGNIRTLNKAMASGNFSERRHSAPPRSCPLCPALAKGTACDRSCFLKVPCRRADRRALLPRRTQLSWSVRY